MLVFHGLGAAYSMSSGTFSPTYDERGGRVTSGRAPGSEGTSSGGTGSRGGGSSGSTYEAQGAPGAQPYGCDRAKCWGTTPARVSELKQVQYETNSAAARLGLRSAALTTNGTIDARTIALMAQVIAKGALKTPALTLANVAASPRAFLAPLMSLRAIVVPAAPAPAPTTTQPPLPTGPATPSNEAPTAEIKIEVVTTTTPPPATPTVVVNASGVPGAGTHIEATPSAAAPLAPAAPGKWKIWAAVGAAAVALGVGVVVAKHGG